MKQNFYVTTPIYYGNGLPHVGHFYSSSIANVIYKHAKIIWKNARFTTGIDENSQKAVIKAQEAWVPIMDYLDSMAAGHKKVWDHFDFDYTDFVRTTSHRHHNLVQKVLQKCFDAWDIYEWEYEGMYCIGCESFKKDEDLVFLNKTSGDTFPVSDKVKPSENIMKICPDHLTTPDTVKEKNYFFRLKNYQTWMEEFYDANPDFVNPSFRYNEVKAFVGRGLEDFSISRETNTFGIKLPFDNSQVTYVWFDALFNYYTSCISSRGWDKNNDNYTDESEFWIGSDENKRNIVHVVWKDIIRFHAIFWPAMLASYFELGDRTWDTIHYKKEDNKYLPNQVLTGGYFTVDGQKMSKTIGNVIEPMAYSNQYNHEMLTLYMLSAFPIGNDGDYDRKDAILNYNAKLANNLWNLVNRVVVLTMKLGEELSGDLYEDAWVVDYQEVDDWIDEGMVYNVEWEKLGMLIIAYRDDFDKYMSEYNLKAALDTSFKFLDSVNKYVDDKEPWTLVKDESKKEELKVILYTIAESLRQVWLNLYPFFPKKMWELFVKLGLSWYVELLEAWKKDTLRSTSEKFIIMQKGEALFMRLDVE